MTHPTQDSLNANAGTQLVNKLQRQRFQIDDALTIEEHLRTELQAAHERYAPHETHDMSDWESTIVTLTETSRYGSIRSCKNCNAEHARTAAGQAMHNELRLPCTEENVSDD